MVWRVAIFFGVVMLVSGGAAAYVVRRGRELVAVSDVRARIAWWALFLSSALPLVRFLAPPDPWIEALSIFGYGIGLACVLAAALLVLVDLPSALARLARRLRKAPPAPAVDAPAVDATPAPMPRREMIRRVAIGASLATAGGASAYAFALGRHDYVLEDVPMRLPRLPRALDGYTIAQLSDVHLGTFVGRREIAAARALVRDARADLVVLTGDLVDHDPRYLTDLGMLVRAMADAGARDGVVAILGNHDYYTGPDDVAATLRAAGVRVLRNEATTIGDAGARFALLGVDDVWAVRNGFAGGADLTAAMRDVDPDHAKVLLCHNPELFPSAAAHVDLQISGHTHGGQVNPIVRPIDLLLPYVAGRYRRGDAQLYVNRGFGTAGPPARLGSPPEVTRITLVAG